jgi:hypothetical protein
MEVKDKQGKNITKPFIIGVVLAILILAIPTIWYNMQLNQQKPLTPNNVHVKIVIQSNVDWEGSVTCTGPDYGFYTVSGSENKTYEYTVNFIDFEIYGQFYDEIFGQRIFIYDGYVRVLLYVDGKLEFNELIKATSDSNGRQLTYRAGYS